MGSPHSKPQVGYAAYADSSRIRTKSHLSLSAEFSMVVNIDQQDPREEYLLIPGQNSKEKPQETSLKAPTVTNPKEPAAAVLCNATFMGRKSDVAQAKKQLLGSFVGNTSASWEEFKESLLIEIKPKELTRLLSDELLEQVPCPLTQEGIICFVKHLERCYKSNTPTLYNILELSDETHHIPLLQKLLMQSFPSGKSVALITYDLGNKVTQETMEEVLSLINIAERMKLGHDCSVFLIGHNFQQLQKKLFNNEEYAKEAFFELYKNVQEKTCERNLKIRHSITHILLHEAQQQVWSAMERDAIQDIGWTAFKLCSFLKAYSKKNSKPKISKGEYIAIASLFDIRQEQAIKILKRLSLLHLVLHWDNNVIIDVQWLLSAFGEIETSMSRRYQESEDSSLVLQEICDELYPVASSWIVQLLESFQLSIDECNNSDMFFSSKRRLLFCLPNSCTKHGNPFHSSKMIAPIYFRLSMGGIPPGYFQRLISFLSKMSNGFECIHCVCKSWAVFELRLPLHRDAYHVYLSSKQENYIKVQFSSAPDVEIPFKEACDAAQHIVKSLSQASETAQRNIASWFVMDSSVSMFLECPDSRCEKEKTHLCRINQQMQRLDCMKNRRYFYLNKCHKGQIPWVKDVVENFESLREDDECNGIFDALLPRTESDVSREIDISLDPYQRSLVLSQLSDPCTAQEKSKARDRGRSVSLPEDLQNIDFERMVDEVLDTNLMQIKECFFPEPEITGFLYQNCIITFDEKRDILEKMVAQPDNKGAAVDIILSAIRRAKGRGLVGLVEGLVANRIGPGDPHVLLRNALINHPRFSNIKLMWIQSEILNL